ncbi:MAG TPA: response regulator transcription factor [Candidatus Dormibacteraeota bacterium]|nr:response regulator transcription factor [Candidatus Dormibacteraeota bacterium]
MLILVVEDEPRIASFLCKGLAAEGYACAVAGDAETALLLAGTEPVDLVLLDLILPDRSGLEVLRALRSRDPRLPILVLTAKDDVGSKVTGLEQGADDYLTKPFVFDELLARIRALIRRDQASAVELRAGGLVLDLRQRSARGAGHQAVLTVRECALLELFVRHPNQVLTRAQISGNAWPYESQAESNVVDVYVRYLRQKVPWPPDVSLDTVRGAGYRLRVGGDG